MMKQFLICISILISIAANSQSFIPYNILQAIENETRTLHGIPGERYFQNSAKYTIDAFFDSDRGRLTGDMKVNYFNNSPDTLNILYLRLYQDIARKGGIRDEEVSISNVHQGTRIRKLIVDGENYSDNLDRNTTRQGTNLGVFLHDDLLPGDSCLIRIKWDFTMPDEHFHRYGKYGDKNFFVAYWYPQVAVYDDLDGWDVQNYTGTHEFYNDFNDFDVRIRVSGDNMIWATGTWQNADKILSLDAFNKYEQAKASDKTVRIVSPDEMTDKTFFRSKGNHEFRYIANDIPDFAFATAKNYLWDAASVIVDSSQNRRVLVSAVYPENTRHFDKVAAIGTKILHHLSFHSYGVPYPFPQVTVFKGDGGMEFPMIVNDGETFLYNGTIFLTMHEVAHAYFPFYTGINERKYSWIDEGLTTYLPMETEKALKSDYYPFEGVVKKYDELSGTQFDIPLYIPSIQTRDYTYQYYSYIRPCIAFHMLENYVGRDVFRSAIKEFIEIWNLKHPTPYDLFAILKNSSNMDIDWFIDKWFYGYAYADIAIGEYLVEDGSLKLEIINVGGMPVPIKLSLIYDEDQREEILISPEVWKNCDLHVVSKTLQSELKEILLGSPEIPDKNAANNRISFP